MDIHNKNLYNILPDVILIYGDIFKKILLLLD